MALQHAPAVGSIVMCEFPSCFTAPEMVKSRPVIVLNPKIPGREDMLTIVPISDTAPTPVFAHHCLLPDEMLPHFMQDGRGRWVKGDMVYTLSMWRMTPVRKKGKDPSGKRVYEYPRLDQDHLKTVRRCVAAGLDIKAELFT